MVSQRTSASACPVRAPEKLNSSSTTDPILVAAAQNCDGLHISGNLLGRKGDTVGIGCARLMGGNQGVDYTDVFEVYGRIAFDHIFGLTGDVQYMKDSMAVGDSPKGWIFGLRLTAEF